MIVMTATQIKKLKCPDGMKFKPYSIDSSCSLYLVCFATGKRLFKKRIKKGYATLGDINEISLAEARELAIKYKEANKNDINKQTISQIYNAWLDVKLPNTDANKEKRRKANNRINKWVLKPLGNKFIDEVDKKILTKATLGLGFESAKKILAMYRDMLKFARNLGAISDIAFIFEMIDDIRVLYSKEPTKHAKMINDKDRLKQIIELVRDSNMRDNLKNMFYLSLLLAQRPHQIRELKWDQIDDYFIYFSPSSNKTKVNARLPLTPKVRQILSRQPKDNELVFPSLKQSKKIGWRLSDATLINNLKRIGINDFHMHGTRGTMATFAIRETEFVGGVERGMFEKRVIDEVLLHTVGSEVDKAYFRDFNSKEHLRLLEWWSEFLSSLASF
ncbi:site-specific recombinase, phage integrase family [Campylobacter iguaniorum]|uniref:tyrosine-type recombinase/integrase n=1 Tax=Campylobacter iguaniorum TaxID=1244531 RepID=UPI00073A03DE|nr:tyrosine-type recombinase/integrase [Campylobacter iguaniorum]ALV25078.1 site-specific recombinase, phage integrase family [Campylobacter iguaniorum]